MKTGWTRSCEVSVADIPLPAESTPVNRARLAERIISGQLTRDEAGGLWGAMADGPTVEKLKHRGLFDDYARTSIDVTMAIVSDGDDALRAALAALARGETADAANRFELLIAQATDHKSELLRFKAALYAFIEPSVATNAIRGRGARPRRHTAAMDAWPAAGSARGLGIEASMQTFAIERVGEDNNAAQTLGPWPASHWPATSGSPSTDVARRSHCTKRRTTPGARRECCGCSRNTTDRGEQASAESQLERALAYYETRGPRKHGRYAQLACVPRARPQDLKTAAAHFERCGDGSAIGKPDYEGQGFEALAVE
jgi:hypothetical protein